MAIASAPAARPLASRTRTFRPSRVRGEGEVGTRRPAHRARWPKSEIVLLIGRRPAPRPRGPASSCLSSLLCRGVHCMARAGGPRRRTTHFRARLHGAGGIRTSGAERGAPEGAGDGDGRTGPCSRLRSTPPALDDERDPPVATDGVEEVADLAHADSEARRRLLLRQRILGAEQSIEKLAPQLETLVDSPGSRCSLHDDPG